MPRPKPEPIYNGAHFTRSVMELSDIENVSTCKPIFSGSGLKLLGEDVPVNSALFKHLLEHSMTPLFEQCLVVNGGITQEDLVEQASQLLRNDLQMARMAKFVGDQSKLLQPLVRVTLAPPVHFLLTLARERRPAMLEHALRVALISTYLGFRAGQSDAQLVQLATAGLLHDIGELHFNPQLFESNLPLSRTERAEIFKHVSESHSILENCGVYSAVVLAAVQEHHECLDRSGYPTGRDGEVISLGGRILAVAETAASKVCQGMWGSVRMEMICKLNRSRLDAHLLSSLSALYSQRSELSTGQRKLPRIGTEEIYGELNKIALIIGTWKEVADKVVSKPNSAFAHISQRLNDLQVVLVDAGINLSGKQSLVQTMGQDQLAMVELAQLNLEIIWQLRELMLGVQRRWPRYENDVSPQGVAVGHWVSFVEELLCSSGRLF